MFPLNRTRTRSWLIAALRGVLLVAVVATAVAVRAEPQPAPAYWKIEKGAATVYLFGTIHLMTADVPWLTPDIDAAFEAADRLVLEVAPDQLAPEVMAPLMVKYGIYTNGDSLKAHLPDALYGPFIVLAGKHGLAEASLGRMRPWLAGVVLSAQIAVANGFLPEHGVDKALIGAAADIGKPVGGLETAEDQVAVFASISEASQVRLLEVSLDQLADIGNLFITMRDSWLGGDLKALAVPINDSLAEVPEVYEALLVRRNRNWAPQISTLLDGQGTTFVAVGAGHLMGEGSLIELLEARGFAVKRQ